MPTPTATTPLAGAHGKIAPEALRRALDHHPSLGLGVASALSLTEITEAGTLYGLDEIAGLAEAARGAGMAVHMDGARFANALAALALCRGIRLPYPPLLKGLQQFRGLPHRAQKIAEFGGVRFYDDSKGTNVGATVAALEGMDGRAVVILGGESKDQDFSPLAPVVGRKARAVVLMGRDRKLIHEALSCSGAYIEHASDMGDAVDRAFRMAQPGESVLLSLACASFDMFRDYVHRASAFANEVKRLEKMQ